MSHIRAAKMKTFAVPARFEALKAVVHMASFFPPVETPTKRKADRPPLSQDSMPRFASPSSLGSVDGLDSDLEIVPIIESDPELIDLIDLDKHQ